MRHNRYAGRASRRRSVPAPVEPEITPPAVSSQPTEAAAAADVQAQIDSLQPAPASGAACR